MRTIELTDFPTDADVEVVWKKLDALSGGFGPEIEYVEAALQAVADARRTEEE